MLICFLVSTVFHVFNLLKNWQFSVIVHCCSYYWHNYIWSLICLINWYFYHAEFLTDFTSHAAVTVYLIHHQSLKFFTCCLWEFCHCWVTLLCIQICQVLICSHSACWTSVCQLIQHCLHFSSSQCCFDLWCLSFHNF